MGELDAICPLCGTAVPLASDLNDLTTILNDNIVSILEENNVPNERDVTTSLEKEALSYENISPTVDALYTGLLEKEDIPGDAIPGDNIPGGNIPGDNIPFEEQKPLYGYEPYDLEKNIRIEQKHQSQSQLQQQAVNTIPQGQYSYPPSNPHSIQQNPYYDNTSKTQYVAGKTKKPKGNRVGLLIILMSCMFVILFVCLLAVIGLLSDINSKVDNYLFYSDYYGYEENGDDYLQEEGISEGSNSSQDSYESYDWLLKDYFTLVTKGDSASIKQLLHPAVIAALEESGYNENQFAEAIDAFIDYYGSYVEEFSVVDVYPYSTSDYTALVDKIGFDQASLEAYIDIHVKTAVRKDGNTEILYYDFDLIKIDGNWYLVSVW